MARECVDVSCCCLPFTLGYQFGWTEVDKFEWCYWIFRTSECANAHVIASGQPGESISSQCWPRRHGIAAVRPRQSCLCCSRKSKFQSWLVCWLSDLVRRVLWRGVCVWREFKRWFDHQSKCFLVYEKLGDNHVNGWKGRNQPKPAPEKWLKNPALNHC